MGQVRVGRKEGVRQVGNSSPTVGPGGNEPGRRECECTARMIGGCQVENGWVKGFRQPCAPESPRGDALAGAEMMRAVGHGQPAPSRVVAWAAVSELGIGAGVVRRPLRGRQAGPTYPWAEGGGHQEARPRRLPGHAPQPRSNRPHSAAPCSPPCCPPSSLHTYSLPALLPAPSHHPSQLTLPPDPRPDPCARV